MKIHSLAKVTCSTGAFITNSGAWNTGANGGVGISNITLLANEGIDPTGCAVLIQRTGAMAASGMTAYGIVHNANDILKNVTCFQEAGAGGPSAAADVDYEVAIISLLGE